MTEYKVELNSGKSILIEDERSLAGLASALCDDGFVQVVRRNKNGYQVSTETPIALLERAVVSIEPV
jgi:hypothetical protein